MWYCRISDSVLGVALVLLVLLLPVGVRAEGFGVGRLDGAVGAETSLLWPIFPGNLFLLRASVDTPTGGDILAGVQFHVPHDREEEGRFSSAAVHLGWRQWVRWGLHVDAVVNAGRGRLENSPYTGQNYSSFDVELMLTAGWSPRFGRFYMSIDPLGISGVIYKSNPWPIDGEVARREGPIYVGNVMLGWYF
jgi:hypothetical protein